MSILNDTPMDQSKGMWDSHPKTTFWMGLFLGFSVSSFIALLCVLMLVLGGKTSGSAVAAAPSQVAAAPSGAADAQQPTADAPSLPPAPVDPAKDHIIGSKNAKVTMIEYSDFECPFCGRHEPTIQQALKDFPKDVRLVYRHYPLSFHPNAQKSAEASECAFKLGGNDAFWKMHAKLFENNTALSLDLYNRLAKEIGLDQAKFKACVDSGETASIVAADEATGNNSGVNGTPATYINDTLVSGAVPYAQFKAQLVAAGAKE